MISSGRDPPIKRHSTQLHEHSLNALLFPQAELGSGPSRSVTCRSSHLGNRQRSCFKRQQRSWRARSCGPRSKSSGLESSHVHVGMCIHGHWTHMDTHGHTRTCRMGARGTPQTSSWPGPSDRVVSSRSGSCRVRRRWRGAFNFGRRRVSKAASALQLFSLRLLVLQPFSQFNSSLFIFRARFFLGALRNLGKARRCGASRSGWASCGATRGAAKRRWTWRWKRSRSPLILRRILPFFGAFSILRILPFDSILPFFDSTFGSPCARPAQKLELRKAFQLDVPGQRRILFLVSRDKWKRGKDRTEY